MTAGRDDQKLFDCPALSALKVISGKWKTRILWLLRERPYHFGDLRRTLSGVSAKVLTEQIQQLEDAGIVLRREITRNGVTFADYQYSDYGRTLIPVLDSLGNWGLTHKADAERANTR
ncbi:winged helix-turn-helix transcriptional regulator [Aliiroseovarius sp. YM-037]|uniref:winged helix-turn-helix transcriptional regulator n=1 Tax=Aliiroseovarius sp. YM-037 TaxID=3341728 RepID=UPI003A8139FC